LFHSSFIGSALAGVTGVISFTDGLNMNIGLFYPPGTDTIFIEVTDPDRDINIGLLDTLSVSFFVESEHDEEILVLTETSNSSGIFRGSIPCSVVPFLLPRPTEEQISNRVNEIQLNQESHFLYPLFSEDTIWIRNKAELSLMQEMTSNYSPANDSIDSRLDEVGVLEITSGSSITCSYLDPSNDWGYEETITQAVIYGGYAGDMSGQTWTAEGSPYFIVGDIIASDVNNPIIIEQGVHVQFTGDFWFQAPFAELNGARGDSIYFEAHPDFNPERWAYFLSSRYVEIDFAVFQGSCRGAINSATNSRFSNHFLLETMGSYTDCIFSSNQPSGLPQFFMQDIVLENCTFSGNLGSGCALGSPHIQIINSTFSNNNGYGLFINSPPATISITGSEFSTNMYSGICINSAGLASNININNCEIYNNFSGFDFYNSSIIDIDATMNNWGEATTAQMNDGPNPKNISTIYDEFDMGRNGRVDYSDYFGNNNPDTLPEIHFTTSSYIPVDFYSLNITQAHLQLSDESANTSTDLRDTVTVTLGAQNEMDNEQLILIETGVNSSIFRGSIPVSMSTLRMNEPDPEDIQTAIISLEGEFPDLIHESLEPIAESRVRKRMSSEDRLWFRPTTSLDEVGILEVYGGDIITAEYRSADDDTVRAIAILGGIAGDISGQMLTSSNSPYVVAGDIYAENLVIQPGTEILFYDNYFFSTYEEFTCQGTESDSIYFRSHPEYLGGLNQKWEFQPSTISEPYEYVVFEDYGTINIAYQTHANHCRFSRVETINYGTISNSIINNSPYENGLFMYNGTVLNSTISSNSGHGISSNRSFEIHDVVIHNNGGYGILLTGSNTSGGIDGCTITGNSYGGIYTGISYGYPIIQGNDIYNNGPVFDFHNESDLDIDARYNNWGPETTAEMDESTGLANISRIYDHFDDVTASTVDYTAYSGSSFSGTRATIRLKNHGWSDIPIHYPLTATTANVEVRDPDRNTVDTQPDTLGVTFTSESESDYEYVILTETGDNTGIFRGLISLNVIDSPSSNRGSHLDELGVLEIAENEAISCSYIDRQSYWNTTEVVTDHAIFGGTEGDVSNQVWTPDNNPYVIVGDCFTVDGQPLIVEAGVEILFAGIVTFDNIGNQFNGTETDSIYIGIHAAYRDSWEELDGPAWQDNYSNQYHYTVFDSLHRLDMSGSDYSNCRVSHIYNVSTESNVDINHCIISENEYGIFLYYCNSFTNNHVVNNTRRGVVVAQCYQFTNNLIEGNGGYGICQNGLGYTQSLRITECIIRNNDGYGITNSYPMYGELIVNDCDLYGNTSGYDIFLNYSPGEVDARFNYWGDETTLQFYQGYHPRNMANIYDNYDHQILGPVNYSNWRNNSITSNYDYFTPPPGLGDYLVIISRAEINIELLEGGDEIGVFDYYEGELICVGASIIPEDIVWEDQNVTVHAVQRIYQDDIRIPGYREGNEIQYKIYDRSRHVEYIATGNYHEGYGNEYGDGYGTFVSLVTETSGTSDDSIPVRFEISSAYPNPTNGISCVNMSLPETGELKYTLYNILGQVVYTSSNLYMAGQHRLLVPLDNYVSGLYFLQVSYSSHRQTLKILYMK